MALTLLRTPIPATAPGIYPLVNGQANRTIGKLPDRFRYLHPEAAASCVRMLGLAPWMRFSDMWRSAAESLHAVETKAGTKRPGYSGHGFGFSVDLDVDDCLRRSGMSKPELDAWMQTNGWWCHRRDGQGGSESWHFNFLGAPTAEGAGIYPDETNTAGAIERKILAVYGPGFNLTEEEVTAALAQCHFDAGDATFAPIASAGVKAFQRAWDIQVTGILDSMTIRTLAFVTATLQDVPLAA